MRSEMPYSPRLARLAPKVLVSTASDARREVGVVDAAHDVGPGHGQDLVAALVALEVVEAQVVRLQHRAHRAVGDDHALGERTAEQVGTGHGPQRREWRASTRRRCQGSGRRLTPVTDLDLVDDLVDPILIAAFEGWNDAADAASSTVDRLIDEWDAEVVAELDPEEYYDFQITRPHIAVEPDGSRVLSWPTTRVLVARPPGASRDIVLLRGVEPNLRWRQFCEELLEIAETLGVRLVVSLGALLADTPHTRPVPVTGTVSDPELAARLGLEQSLYEGPTGITGVFQDACAAADMPSLSLWAAVPHVRGAAAVPQGHAGAAGPAGGPARHRGAGRGPGRGRAGVGARGRRDGPRRRRGRRSYVKQLEEEHATSELPEASGDAIAREFERYLKRRQREGEV